MTAHPCGCHLQRAPLPDYYCDVHTRPAMLRGVRSVVPTTQHPRRTPVRTPMLRQTLLTLGVALAVLAGALLLVTRDASGGEPESCGPQDLVVTEDTATVDPEGCEVELVVFQAVPGAIEVCLDFGGCIQLPQVKTGYVAGTGPLSLPLPDCGWYQVDVFDVGLLATLEELTADIVNDPAALLAWGNAHPEYFEGLLAGATGETGVVCTPEPEPTPAPQPEPEPGPPAVLPRPPGAAHPAPVVAADPAFTG